VPNLFTGAHSKKNSKGWDKYFVSAACHPRGGAQQILFRNAEVVGSSRIDFVKILQSTGLGIRIADQEVPMLCSKAN